MSVSNEVLKAIAEELYGGNSRLLEREFENLVDFAMYAMRKFTFDATEKEDVFQEAMMKFVCFCQSAEYKEKAVENWSSFLWTIIRNTCLDHWRQRSPTQEYSPDIAEHNPTTLSLIDMPSPVNQIDQERIENIVYSALEQLPPKDVQIILEINLGLEKQNWVARQMGWSPPRLHYRYKRALVKLRKSLGELADQCDRDTLATLLFQAVLKYIENHDLKINVKL